MIKLTVNLLNIVLLCFAIYSPLYAQKWDNKYSTKSDKAIKYFEKAQLSFDARKDADAIELLQKAIKTDNNFIEAHMFLAEVFAENKNYTEALQEAQIATSINADFFTSAYYSMGFWCLKLQSYNEAEKNFRKYLSYKNISAQAKANASLGLKSALFAQQALKNPVPFNPQNLGAEINSSDNDYLPAITADEQKLIFTRLISRDPSGNSKDMRNKQEDFYSSIKINEHWSKAKNIGPPINTIGNEGAQCISADGQTLIFTACKEYDGYPGGRKGFGSCDLFIAKKLPNGNWGTPENMGKPINTESWDSQPSLTSDGQTLYFVSNRPGGKGGSDIWRSTKSENGKWGIPVNLGDSVNTHENEESPFIHPDNKTLYFSSEGWPGMGSKDLYVVRLKSNQTFGTPVNLGYPINTSENERDLIVSANAKTAYFSSERSLGYGGLDLYNFELYEAVRPEAVTYVKGKVLNKENNNGLEAKFELVDLANGQTVMQASSMAGTGEFLVCLPANKNYLMNVSKNGFLFASENFSLKGMSNDLKPFEKNVGLTPIKVGEKVILKNIFFETASYSLKDESRIELQKLKAFLVLNPNIKIQICGHTDNIGDKKSNQLLSENRAKAVFDFLINQDITKERLSFKGYGDLVPIDSNDTEMGRANNRRTEFIIIN